MNANNKKTTLSAETKRKYSNYHKQNYSDYGDYEACLAEYFYDDQMNQNPHADHQVSYYLSSND